MLALFININMNLIDQAIIDAKKITSDAAAGFGVEMVFKTPDEITTATINGLHTKIHLGIDTDGVPVNSKKASVAFSEALLVSAGYTVRNANQEVSIVGHQVSVKDSTGIVKKYTIQQCFPDETIGVLVCILEDLA